MNQRPAEFDTDSLNEAIDRLVSTGRSQDVTLDVDVGERTQALKLTSVDVPERPYVAHSHISPSDSIDEEQLLEWASDYEVIQFRRLDGWVVAYLRFGVSMDRDILVDSLQRLARIADQLEYEVGEGADAL